MKTLVRKTLGVKDHKVISVEQVEGKLIIVLDRKRRRRLPCSNCGIRSPVYDRLPARVFQHVPLWNIAVELVYAPSRVQCPHCGVKVERIPWSEGKSRLTTPLVIVLAEESKLLSLSVVAKKYGVSWSTVASAVKQAVEYGLAHRELEGLKALGVDELSRRKGHIYHTQVYDLEQKRLLDSLPERKTESLEQFLDGLGPVILEGIRAVCCDMWEPYARKVRERLPQAVLVFDKFHIIRHLLEAVNNVRKTEAAQLKPIRDFAWLLRNHEREILAWHDCPINNGAVEALNNVAKSISHRCHGFRTAKWFRLVLLLCMGKLPMPKFTHKFA